MKELRDKIAHELGKAINEHANTFEGELNWFLFRKQRKLGEMLDDIIELIKEEEGL